MLQKGVRIVSDKVGVRECERMTHVFVALLT